MTAIRSTVAFRFGYGLPLPDGAPQDADAMMALLNGADQAVQRWPIPGMDELVPVLRQLRRPSGPARNEPAALAIFQQARIDTELLRERAIRATIARSLDSPDGFRERMVAFWVDHFTVMARNPGNVLLSFLLVDEAIRANITGSFDAMLTATILQPAMLIYLDQTQSFGPGSQTGQRKGLGLNENLAREMIELHTLGVGAGYSQDDVRQMAELLTGLVVDPLVGMGFDGRRAEPGDETVLGKTYSGEGLEPIKAALRDVALRPETAAHISRKLAVHFVSDDPDPALVAALQDAWVSSSGHLGQVYAALLAHPAAWVRDAHKVRQPYEFVVAALRALGLTGQDIVDMDEKSLSRLILGGMRAMGQPFKAPRGPDGWPERAETWITPIGLAARINWAMTVPARLVAQLPDPVRLAQTALDDRAGEQLLWAAARAESVKEGVGLVLASPEFNRR